MTEAELFDLATYRRAEIIEEVWFQFFKARDDDDDGSFSLRAGNNSNMSDWFTEQRHRNFGKCFTLTPEPWMKQLGIHFVGLRL